MAADTDQAAEPWGEWDERLEVRRRRYKEARRAGLTIAEAELFADGGCDVGLLRQLVRDGCPLPLLAAIVV